MHGRLREQLEGDALVLTGHPPAQHLLVELDPAARAEDDVDQDPALPALHEPHGVVLDDLEAAAGEGGADAVDVAGPDAPVAVLVDPGTGVRIGAAAAHGQGVAPVVAARPHPVVQGGAHVVPAPPPPHGGRVYGA